MASAQVTIQVNVVDQGRLVRARWQEPVNGPTTLRVLIERAGRGKLSEAKLLCRWLQGELRAIVLLDDRVVEPDQADQVMVAGGQTIRVLTPVAGG
jgi:sulfur carrier protein ThiS